MRRSDQRRAAVVTLYQEDVTGGAAEPQGTDFTRELVVGVRGERDALDTLIERHSVGWALDRIAPLERSILRVALFELLHRPDVPAEVAIDEAIEAAKELCSVEAPGFVNGILGAVVREGEVASR
ncbi:MAG: transcription antitermination factor NusB [Thermoleophilaceae bacterium]